jgi:Tol biopolymer transport system component
VDLSPDGTRALVRAGQLTINGPEPECVDLYSVPTDGSGATRLTPFRGGRAVSGAAFSPDGSRVAYSWWDRSDANTITVLDIASGQTVDQPCKLNFGFSPDRISWSPSGGSFAIVCYETLVIFDASGATDPVPFSSPMYPLSFAWTDSTHLHVAVDGGDIRSFDIETGTSTSISRFDLSDIEAVIPSSGGFSPDGRWLAFLGGERGDRPGNDFRIVEYLVPTSGGTPTRILNENEAASTIAWSMDGRALIAAHETGRLVDDVPEVTLGRLDPETGHWSKIGPLLRAQGVWHIP